MSNPQPSIPPGPPVAAIPVDKSSSLWDRVSSWASENKAAVYTIAGVAVVVTGAGIVYYLNTPAVRLPSPDHPISMPRLHSRSCQECTSELTVPRSLVTKRSAPPFKEGAQKAQGGREESCRDAKGACQAGYEIPRKGGAQGRGCRGRGGPPRG